MLSFLKKVIYYLTVKFQTESISPEREEKLNEFQNSIKYKFKNKTLIIAALTHDSYLRRKDFDDITIKVFSSKIGIVSKKRL